MFQLSLIDVSNALILRNCVYIFINGVMNSIIVLGVSPLLESSFQIITPYGLAELGDHNQPLLKRLQVVAQAAAADGEAGEIQG